MTAKTDLAIRLAELNAAATPGPWIAGDPFAWAGILEESYGPGKCAYCGHKWKLVWMGLADINGKKMLAHLHLRPKPSDPDHTITARPKADVTVDVAGNYDYEEGGIVSKSDLALIVYLRNHTEAILRLAEAARQWANTMSEHDRLMAAGEPIHQACLDHEVSKADLTAAQEALND